MHDLDTHTLVKFCLHPHYQRFGFILLKDPRHTKKLHWTIMWVRKVQSKQILTLTVTLGRGILHACQRKLQYVGAMWQRFQCR